MKIEIATIDDVPELMVLHDKAFFAIAAEVDWLDAPGLKESLEQAYEDFHVQKLKHVFFRKRNIFK